MVLDRSAYGSTCAEIGAFHRHFPGSLERFGSAQVVEGENIVGIAREDAFAASGRFGDRAVEERLCFGAHIRLPGLIPESVPPVRRSAHGSGRLGDAQVRDGGAAVGAGGVARKLVAKALKHLIGFLVVVVEHVLVPL